MTAETKRTPGPWGASSPDAPEQGVFGCGYRVAMMTGGEIGRDRANARLIAAAPELLKALGALGVIRNGYCFCSHDRDPDKVEHQPECRDARAAIAKAEGRR